MKEIKVGIVGSGFIADVHAQAISTLPHAMVSAHCGFGPDRARKFAKKHHVENSYKDYGQLLKESDIDVVILCVPNHLHAPMTIQAAKAGKHVIVEKPLCLTLEQGEHMIDQCRSSGVLLGYAEELCFAPKYVQAKQLADDGAVGRIYRVNQVEKHAGPYSEWFFKPETAGGGIVMDMGCHSIEWARWMFSKTKLVAVTAMMNTVMHKARTHMEDDTVIYLEFEGGRSALLESSWALHGGMDSYGHVLGDAGVIHVDLLKGQGLLVHSTAGFGQDPSQTRGWTWPDYEWNWNNGYPQEDAHFLQCIRDGSQPTETGEDGLEVLKIIHACYESAARGCRIELPYEPPTDIKAPVELWLRRGKD